MQISNESVKNDIFKQSKKTTSKDGTAFSSIGDIHGSSGSARDKNYNIT